VRSREGPQGLVVEFLTSSGFAGESPTAPAPAPPVSRWRSSSSNQHRPVAGRQRTPSRRAGPRGPGIQGRQVPRTTRRIRRWSRDHLVRSRLVAAAMSMAKVLDDQASAPHHPAAARSLGDILARATQQRAPRGHQVSGDAGRPSQRVTNARHFGTFACLAVGAPWPVGRDMWAVGLARRAACDFRVGRRPRATACLARTLSPARIAWRSDDRPPL